MAVDIVTYRMRIGTFNIKHKSLPLNGHVLISSGFVLWLILFLMLAGDVELNPGPVSAIPGIMLNTRSLKSVTNRHNKLSQFRSLVSLREAKLICLTETWLDSSISNSELIPDDDFSIYRRDRNGYGGVLIAIHNATFSSKLRPDLIAECDVDLEIIVVEIDMGKHGKTAIVNYYNSPTNPSTERVKGFKKTLKLVSECGFKNICVFGDFNLPNLELNTGIPLNSRYFSQEYYDTFNDHNLLHCHSLPTHRSGNRLDLILSSNPSIFSDIFTEDTFPSDHLVVYFSVTLNSKMLAPAQRTVYNYNKANWVEMRQAILDTDLINVIDNANSDVDKACQLWTQAVQKIASKFIPKFQIKNKNSPPWIDGEVIHLSNKKETTRRKAHRKNSDTLWANYRLLRNKLNNLVNSKYISYISNTVDSISKNPKRLWGLLRVKCKNKNIPDVMRMGSELANSARDKANMFNNFFYSNFTRVTNAFSFPSISEIIDLRLSSTRVTFADIRLILDNLDSNKATGPDEISGRILKECARELTPSITKLCNLSLSQGKFPHSWKLANVVPVYKKGCRDSVENYRPVSLLSIVSKVLERAVINNIYDVLIPKLTLLQHGFLRGKSTVTQLLSVFHEISSHLDNSGQTDVIYLDFSKAFDSVPHHLLIHKLKSFGFNGSLLNWIGSYLTNRTQRVVIDGEMSSCLPVVSGVPQGSILGPLLFLLYINDISNDLSSDSKIALFADDAKIFRHIFSLTDCISLQSDLSILESWSKIWLMNFNAKKCKVMSIARKVKHTFKYYLNGMILDHVNEFNDLGVIISSNMTWSAHIRSKVSKANQLLGMIRRSIGVHAPVRAKKWLLSSFIKPSILYASVIWSAYKHELNLIELVKRRASKRILN